MRARFALRLTLLRLGSALLCAALHFAAEADGKVAQPLGEVPPRHAGLAQLVIAAIGGIVIIADRFGVQVIQHLSQAVQLLGRRICLCAAQCVAHVFVGLPHGLELTGGADEGGIGVFQVDVQLVQRFFKGQICPPPLLRFGGSLRRLLRRGTCLLLLLPLLHLLLCGGIRRAVQCGQLLHHLGHGRGKGAQRRLVIGIETVIAVHKRVVRHSGGAHQIIQSLCLDRLAVLQIAAQCPVLRESLRAVRDVPPHTGQRKVAVFRKSEGLHLLLQSRHAALVILQFLSHGLTLPFLCFRPKTTDFSSYGHSIYCQTAQK